MGQMMSSPASDQGQASLAKVEAELEVIFGGSGKQVLMKEVTERYGVSLMDALNRPSTFQSALFYLLGDLGSHMVMGRINKRVWGSAVPPQLK
ncbi:MAG TPA: hypothetical protein VFE91_06070 [Nitrososphaerales archaeon]|nr:hypothetical protein [Nitrososphaerales archaeon]